MLHLVKFRLSISVAGALCRFMLSRGFRKLDEVVGLLIAILKLSEEHLASEYQLQQYFIEDMKHAIFAEPREDGNGMLVNFVFHSQHAGNSFFIKIEDKLREFEAGADEYFRDIEEICPSLKM